MLQFGHNASKTEVINHLSVVNFTFESKDMPFLKFIGLNFAYNKSMHIMLKFGTKRISNIKCFRKARR